MRLLLICAAALPLGACHASWEHHDNSGHAAQSSGPGAVRSYAATGFTGVDLRGSDDIHVKIGPTFAVQAEGNPKLLDQLDIRVDGETLRVGRKDHEGWNWSHDDSAKITVTMPRLLRASVAGSGNLDADAAEGDFDASVAGSGNLKVTQIKGGAVALSVAGSGDLQVAGSAAKLTANTAGSGDIDAKGLTATSASVSIAGSGSVRGTVNGEASVSIIGSGDADLGGGAHCKVSSVGSGDARCG